MVPLVPLTNFAIYAVLMIGFWIAAPLPSGNRLYNFRTMFDTSGVKPVEGRLAGAVFVIGLVVPAGLGLAPIDSWPPIPSHAIPGILYVGCYPAAVITAVNAVGCARVTRALRSSTETELTEPPTEGPNLVTGEARAPDSEAADDGAVEDLVHDFRLDILIMSGKTDGVDSLKHVSPFVLEGPAGSIHVDPTDAHVALYGRYKEERQIDDGDELLVLGTVQTDASSQFRMSGEDDLLYISNETPDEFRQRIRKGLYGGSLLAILFSVIAAAAMNAIVGTV